jgi:hypothetical protein
MPEVTAVVLSIGEPTTARAVESVRKQTRPVSNIVLVQGVTPFHRALNQGASDVAAPFFIQVDADMVLDLDCVERLAACLTDTVGLVTGFLRDPLYGRIEAVKLFRTACVRRHPFRDSLSPDTDFVADIAREGWADVYALRHSGRTDSEWHTFGDHDPGYTRLYTYAKHVVEGRRWRYRRNAVGLQHQLHRLYESAHPAAPIASVALAHGVFLDREGDLLGRYREDADFRRLTALLDGGPEVDDGTGLERPPLAWLPKTTFRRSCQLGISLGRARRARRFQRLLHDLASRRHPWSFLAQIGLCHGLFLERFDAQRFEQDWTTLRTLWSFEPAEIVRLLARPFLGRIRRRGAPARLG